MVTLFNWSGGLFRVSLTTGNQNGASTENHQQAGDAEDCGTNAVVRMIFYHNVSTGYKGIVLSIVIRTRLSKINCNCSVKPGFPTLWATRYVGADIIRPPYNSLIWLVFPRCVWKCFVRADNIRPYGYSASRLAFSWPTE